MLRKLLFLLLLFPVLASQDVLYPHASYWVDDFNVRNHVSYHALGNMMGQPNTLMKWDEKDNRFESLLPDLLQDRMIARNKYRHVTSVRTNLDGHSYKYDFEQLSPVEISKIFDSLSVITKADESISLIYDDEGYLVQKIRKERLGVPNCKHTDTTSFKYFTSDDGSKRIERTVSDFQYDKRSYNQSIYYGNMNGRSLTVKSKYVTSYMLNSRDQLTSIRSDYESMANGVITRDSFHLLKTYVYDEIGRPLIILDSSTSKKELTERLEYTYEDIPLAKMKNKEQYPALQVPIIQKWLAAHTALIFTKTIKKKIAKGAPQDKPEEEYFITDASHALLMQLDTAKTKCYGNNLIFHYTHDSTGVYRGEFRFDDFPDITDTNTYIPDQKPIGQTLHHGCIIETIYEQPKGTIKTCFTEYTERKTLGAKGEWQKISYKRYQGHGYLWTPQILHYPGTNPRLTDFILVDPSGVVRYYYENEKLIKLTYEK